MAVAPKSTALPHEGQKRAVPGTALPQAGQLMIAAEYITARFEAQTLTRGKPKYFLDELRENHAAFRRKVSCI